MSADASSKGAGRWRRLVPPRDTLYLLTAAVTMFFLALDTWLSHLSSGNIRTYEWIPVVFGLVAGILLFGAGGLSLIWRGGANVLATGVYLASAVVGVLGAWLHWTRLEVPEGDLIEDLVGHAFVHVPPVLAPLAFLLVAVLGLSALFDEEPLGSGRVRITRKHTVHMPLAKERAYLLLVTLGIVIAVVSATMDHAHSGFRNPWMWVATGAGVFATVAVLAYALAESPTDADHVTVLVALATLALAGLLGEGLHLWSDFRLGQGRLLVEKFIRGAPPLAPLLYVYMATLGFIAVLPLRRGSALQPDRERWGGGSAAETG